MKEAQIDTIVLKGNVMQLQMCDFLRIYLFFNFFFGLG